VRRRPVQWSRTALDELKQQIAFIAADNPRAAQRVRDSLRSAAVALGEGATGRPGRVAGTYEKPVPRLPYIIAYEITRSPVSEYISILRVIHTARDWPEDRWPD
jgi:plasmid stabilization system protein ParE